MNDTVYILIRSRVGLPLVGWGFMAAVCGAPPWLFFGLLVIGVASLWLSDERWHLTTRGRELVLEHRVGLRHRVVARFPTTDLVRVTGFGDSIELATTCVSYTLRCASRLETMRVLLAVRMRLTRLGVRAAFDVSSGHRPAHCDTYRPRELWIWSVCVAAGFIAMAVARHWVLAVGVVGPAVHLAYTCWERRRSQAPATERAEVC